jgi:hypothetical protein
MSCALPTRTGSCTGARLDLVLVSIVAIVILLTMGNQIQSVFSKVVAALG